MEKAPWSIWVDTGGTFTDCIAADPSGRWYRVKVLSTGRLRGRLYEKLGAGRYRLAQQWRLADSRLFAGYTLFAAGTAQPLAGVAAIDRGGTELTLDADLDLDLPLDIDISAGEEAPLLATRLVTGTALGQAFPRLRMRLGSTKGTNALLERQGARVGLLITEGFTDLPLIGTQQRPDLFELDIPAAESIAALTLAVPERLDAQGEAIQPLEPEAIPPLLERLFEARVEAVAVSLLHAYRNPAHERALAEALRSAGIAYVSTSQALAPSIRLLPRTRTALVNAYLEPVIATYLGHIQEGLRGQAAGLRIMSSSGGLVDASRFAPKDSLLSGPAGGVVGASDIASRLGFDRVITLDMGGTSADTARYDGHFDYQYITRIDAFEVMSPALSMETVAAGGGSLCGFDGEKLFVGPQSAGASPGPACYGAGGPLTVTDVNLLLGKLDPEAMGIPIRMDRARSALEKLCRDMEEATGEPYRHEEVLRGLEQIADEKMAEAIRRISVAKGFDPSDYALLAFGGAGGLHACRLAETLEMDTVIVPYDAGLLSAYGMGRARVERFAEQQVLRFLEEVISELSGRIRALAEEAIQAVVEEGFDRDRIPEPEILFYLRLEGQESPLEIVLDDPAEVDGLAAAFERKYRSLFGHYPGRRQIEIESIRVRAAALPLELESAEEPAAPCEPEPRRTLHLGGESISTPVFYWDNLQVGAAAKGPAILLSPFATAYVADGWDWCVRAGRNIVARRVQVSAARRSEQKEAIELELFTNRFTSIAEAMGAQLQRTAFSVNIKERLDFSCALLDRAGRLLVNAPHIPVHLGSLGICARLVMEKRRLEPGDVVITNHPLYGGSHLPDITLLAGVFDEEGILLGYVINRAHHAEIGGRRPGSMPPDARNLAEEGVVISPTYLVRGGTVLWDEMERLFTGATFPTRALEENMADINAALAALRTGASALRELVDQHGRQKVGYFMERVRESARKALADALRPLRGRSFSATEYLDDGHVLQVQIEVEEKGLRIDFSGTSPVHPQNLNANLAIVYSAVIYVLRLLCGQPIPLNDGLMEGVDLYLPPDTFLHPDFSDEPASCPAVVGGNTEVSQRLVDTLLRAFGLAACSQGTMNNFLFGNDTFGYYETIGGGAGATARTAGRSAVHQHMTNTRITDPEELEFRYPVRLRRFAIRPDSGGRGKHPGGNGIIRDFEFLEPVEATLLSQHRRECPYGLEGGASGAPGEQAWIHRDGSREKLPGICSVSVNAGDRIVICTPGGGGWGKPD